MLRPTGRRWSCITPGLHADAIHPACMTWLVQAITGNLKTDLQKLMLSQWKVSAMSSSWNLKRDLQKLMLAQWKVGTRAAY